MIDIHFNVSCTQFIDVPHDMQPFLSISKRKGKLLWMSDFNCCLLIRLYDHETNVHSVFGQQIERCGNFQIFTESCLE